jgi:hypothetical protein
MLIIHQVASELKKWRLPYKHSRPYFKIEEKLSEYACRHQFILLPSLKRTYSNEVSGNKTKRSLSADYLCGSRQSPAEEPRLHPGVPGLRPVLTGSYSTWEKEDMWLYLRWSSTPGRTTGTPRKATPTTTRPLCRRTEPRPGHGVGSLACIGGRITRGDSGEPIPTFGGA